MRRFAKVLVEVERELNVDGPATFDSRVAAYRKALRVEDKWLELQHRRPMGGLALGRMRADTVDDFLRHLMEVAVAKVVSEGGRAPRLVLMALGGYGRRELNPKSDVDISFLRDSGVRLASGIAEIVKDVLHVIFACDLTPGHSTRNISESIAEANKEMQSKTAMLEARFLWGEEPLFTRFQERFQRQCVEGHLEDYLRARLEDQVSRHSRYGRTVYMQEPNIKNGCGGLRDYQNLLWMAYFKYGVRSTKDLTARKYLNETEQRELDRAYDFIFRVRTELHYVTGRHVDVILVGNQKDLADRVGYREKFPNVLLRTEALMRDYYGNARAIYEIAELVSERLALPTREEPGSGGFFKFLPFRKRRTAARVEFDGFAAIGDRLFYRDRDIFKEDKARMMRLFQHAQLRGLRISPELRQLVRRRLKYVDNTFRYLKANREVFAEILRKKGQVGPSSARCTGSISSGAGCRNSDGSRRWCSTNISTATPWTSTRSSALRNSMESWTRKSPGTRASGSCSRKWTTRTFSISRCCSTTPERPPTAGTTGWRAPSTRRRSRAACSWLPSSGRCSSFSWTATT